jgi:hypothetical protein
MFEVSNLVHRRPPPPPPRDPPERPPPLDPPLLRLDDPRELDARALLPPPLPAPLKALPPEERLLAEGELVLPEDWDVARGAEAPEPAEGRDAAVPVDGRAPALPVEGLVPLEPQPRESRVLAEALAPLCCIRL